MARVEQAHKLLSRVTADHIVVCSHAGFMGAWLWSVMAAPVSDGSTRMKQVHAFTHGLSIPNVGIVTCRLEAHGPWVSRVRVSEWGGSPSAGGAASAA